MLMKPIVVDPAVQQRNDALDRAKAILDSKGWCQHQQTDEIGRKCLLGAVYGVTSGVPGIVNTLTAIMFVLEVGDPGAAACWNDRPWRTRQDVLDVLEKAKSVPLYPNP